MAEFIKLSDRVKETSETTGSGNMQLLGAAVGFSAFTDYYSHNDLVFYAMTDGTSYEVGSGQYLDESDPGTTYNQIKRYPIRTKGNTVTDPLNVNSGCVNWGVGLKEIYVTYPADYSVYTASGLDSAYKKPEPSGLAFWETENILNYDSSGIWDSTNKRLGIVNAAPSYAIDIGGPEAHAVVRASGMVVDQSGVTFPSGQQHWHFLPNLTDSATGSDAVVEFTGDVSEKLTLKKQAAGSFLSGPASGCEDGNGTCADGYPSFRAISRYDLPDFIGKYAKYDGEIYSSGVAIWTDSGVLGYDSDLIWQSHEASKSLIVKGNLQVQGDTTFLDSVVVTVADKNLELASLSGSAIYNDSLIDDAGLIIKSSGVDKKWTWKDATDAWTTAQKIDVSGVILDDGSVVESTPTTVATQNFRAGYQAGLSAVQNDYTVMVGVAAGASASGSSQAVMIGGDAGNSSLVSMSGIMIGKCAGQYASGVDFSVILGHDAGYASYNSDHSVMIGSEAAMQASGTDEAVALGYRTAKDVINSDRLIAIGSDAAGGASGMSYSILIGNSAGKDTYYNNSVTDAGLTAIGSFALSVADENKDVEAIGGFAGRLSSGNNYTTMLGNYAGVSSSGCNNVAMLGRFAGYRTWGADSSTIIGNYAGDSAYNFSSGIAIGPWAARYASGNFNMYIGPHAGTYASGSNNLEIASFSGNPPILGESSYKLNIQHFIKGDAATSGLSVGPNATLSPTYNLESASGGFDAVFLKHDGAPVSTANALYRSGSTLYWNGATVGGVGELSIVSGMLVATSGYLAADIHSVSGVGGKLHAISGIGVAANTEGNMYTISGYLNTDIAANTNLIYNSGDAATALTVASGTAGIAYTVASGTAIRADLTGASGALQADITNEAAAASGMIHAISGYGLIIHSVSGIGITNSHGSLYSVSGLLRNDLNATSGNHDASWNAVSGHGNLYSVSGLLRSDIDLKAPISTTVTLTGDQDLTNKGLISPNISGSVSGDAIQDDDSFSSVSATKLASSESIKAYVDDSVSAAGGGDITGATFTTDDSTAVSDTGPSNVDFSIVGGASNGISTSGINSLNEIHIDIDTSVVTTLTGSQVLTNKTLTSPVFNTQATGTAIKDEDDMASDSATHLATQQSIKAYVDAQGGNKFTTFKVNTASMYTAGYGTDDIVADAAADTMHILGSGAVEIQTDATNDAIAIGVDLNPVSGRTTTNNNFLHFNGSWQPKFGADSGNMHAISGALGAMINQVSGVGFDMRADLGAGLVAISGDGYGYNGDGLIATASGTLASGLHQISGIKGVAGVTANPGLLHAISGIGVTAHTQGNMYTISGYLSTDIANEKNTASGMIHAVSGVGNSVLNAISGVGLSASNGNIHTISGQLAGYTHSISGVGGIIHSVSGLDVKAHGSLYSVSGLLRSDITVNTSNITAMSGIGNSGVKLYQTSAGQYLDIDPIWMSVESGIPTNLYKNHAIKIGAYAGLNATSGADGSNLYAGPFAGVNSQSNDYNLVLGVRSASGMTHTQGALAFGTSAGVSSSGNDNSLMIGVGVATSSSGNTRATMIGPNAADTSSGVINSEAIGQLAAVNALNLNRTQMIGARAGASSKSNDSSVFIGANAGQLSTQNSGVTSIGEYSSYSADLAVHSIAIGKRAGAQATNTHRVTMIGEYAGNLANSVSGCFFAGYLAGQSMKNSSGVIAIGYRAGQISSSIENGTAIGGFSVANTDSVSIGYLTGSWGNVGTDKQPYGVFLGCRAGHGRWGDLNATNLPTPGNVFIGHRAGEYGNGAHCISILANGPSALGYATLGTDIINGGTTSVSHYNVARKNYRFNIANVIGGDHTDTVRRTSMGVVTADPEATLHLKPVNATTTPLLVDQQAGQSNDMVRARMSTFQNGFGNACIVNGAANTVTTENPIINSAGLLRLPIFDARHLSNAEKGQSLPDASENPGIAVILRFSNSISHIVYSDGVRWHGPGLGKDTQIGSAYGPHN